MSEHKLKTGKLGDKVIGTYRKVEDAFVDRFLEKDPNDPGVLRMKPGKLGKAVMQGYQTMEGTVVGAYKKVEDAFVDTFLEKTGAEDARETPEAVPGTAAPGEAKGESDPSKL